MHNMATDEDGFRVVKRRGRRSAPSRAPRKATASLELPITTSSAVEDILARLESYKYGLASYNFCQNYVHPKYVYSFRDSLQKTQFYHEVNGMHKQ